MKKLVVMLMLIALIGVAQETVPQETTHTVKIDDTLWDIAHFYYQNAFLWPYIWRANLTKIQDPHWIYPDQVFVIPPSPEATAIAPETTGMVVTPPPVYVPPAPAPVKKSAEVISVVKGEEHIFSEPSLHRAGFIVTEDLPLWGKITGTEPEHEKTITTFDRVYIDRTEDVKVGDILTIYRKGKDYDSPKTGKFLGKEIIILGKAEVQELGEEGARCKVINSYDVIKVDDLVRPYELMVAPSNVTLVDASRELLAYIVDLRDIGKEVTNSNIYVVLDQGEEAQVAVGDVFNVYEERDISGKKMPDFTIGTVQVLSVFQNASIGLLTWKRETGLLKRGESCRLVQEAR